MKKLTVFSLILAYIAFLGQLLLYHFRYTVNIIFWDEWEIVDVIAQPLNILQLVIKTGNEHRLGAGLLFFIKPLAEITAWNTRAEVFLTIILLTVSSLVALALKYKGSRKITVWDGIIPVMFFSLYQGDNVLNGYQLLFILPFFWMLVATWLYTYRPSVLRDILLVCTVFLSVFSHFHGLFLGIFTSCFYFCEAYGLSHHHRLFRFGLGVLCLVLVAIYFINFPIWQFDSVSQPWQPLGKYMEFMMAEINFFFGLKVNTIWRFILPVIVSGCGIGSFVLLVRTHKRYWFSVFCLGMYSWLFILSTAYGRIVDYTMIPAYQTRYVTHVIPLFLMVWLFIQETPRRFHQKVLIGVFIGFMTLYFWNNGQNYEYASEHHLRRSAWVECYKTTNDVPECNRRAGYLVFAEEMNPYVAEKLEVLKEKRWNLFAE